MIGVEEEGSSKTKRKTRKGKNFAKVVEVCTVFLFTESEDYMAVLWSGII